MKWSIEDTLALGGVVVIVLIVVGTLFVAVAQPYFEAKAFNKFTSGPKATYWDAMWTELRVISEATPENSNK